MNGEAMRTYLGTTLVLAAILMIFASVTTLIPSGGGQPDVVVPGGVTVTQPTP